MRGVPALLGMPPPVPSTLLTVLTCVPQMADAQASGRPAELTSRMIQLSKVKQRAAAQRAAMQAAQEKLDLNKAALSKALAEASKVGTLQAHWPPGHLDSSCGAACFAMARLGGARSQRAQPVRSKLTLLWLALPVGLDL